MRVLRLAGWPCCLLRSCRVCVSKIKLDLCRRVNDETEPLIVVNHRPALVRRCTVRDTDLTCAVFQRLRPCPQFTRSRRRECDLKCNDALEFHEATSVAVRPSGYHPAPAGPDAQY